jgi:hypothetical protein
MKKKKKKMTVGGVGSRQWDAEWQWLVDFDTNRKRRSVRSFWYQMECGSGSIGSVVKV